MLQFWLPLNKDLRNQGCTVTTTTYSGAALSAANNAYYFDGTDDYISVSNVGSVIRGGTNPFSISFWFYHSGNSRRGVFFGNYGIVSTTEAFNIEITAQNRMRFWWKGSPDWQITATNFTVNTQTWYHVVFSYDGSKEYFYVDGVIKETRTGALSTMSSTSAWYLGRDSRTGATSFYGYMRDFRIYDHALSVKEVHELSLGLFVHYKFNSLTDYSLDYSGFDHKLIQTNGTPQLQGDSVKYDNAMKLNGSTGFMSEEFYTPVTCTYCMWVKKPSGTSTGFFIDARKNNTGVQPIYTSGTTFQVYSTTGGSNNYSISIPSNVWQHYAVVMTATGNKVYVNGVLNQSGTTAKGVNLLTYITLGMRHSQATYLTCAMNDIRMYLKELTAEEIFNIYNDSIIIDNEQNTYCYELDEATFDNNMFNKNGLIKTNDFEEGDATKVFSNSLEVNQIYEL